MLAWTDSLFYIAFVGQIFLLSWYFPTLILERMRYVHKTYPPEKYPRLYPQAAEKYLAGQLIFLWANRLIMALGFVILYSIMFLVDHSTFADDGYISEAFPAAYGMLQFVPLMILELSSFGQMKMMRKANASSKRTAELVPRRLTNFVSPMLIVLAGLMILASITVDLLSNGFPANTSFEAYEQSLVLVVTNLFFVAFGAWQLRGRNLNPHQATADRIRQIRINLNSFMFVSVLMSAFFILQSADQVYDLDYLDAAFLSLYFQAVAAMSIGYSLKQQPLDEINFDVYKENGAATA